LKAMKRSGPGNQSSVREGVSPWTSATIGQHRWLARPGYDLRGEILRHRARDKVPRLNSSSPGEVVLVPEFTHRRTTIKTSTVTVPM
jgi:hypothetical protein